ncbi:MAG: hypothetical protein JXB06_12900 [Spirochaetales bacterium]|nr:hypothetical protein [Spirochaetales bacterium]
MKIRRMFFLFNAIWELVRFCCLFLAVWLVFHQILETNRQAVFWLLVFANGGLLMTAALLFLYLDPRRFRALLNLVRLGKILGLFSALLLIVLEPVGTSLRFLSIGFFPYGIAPFTLLLAVCVVDLIFLFLLFSYQKGQSSRSAGNAGTARGREDPPLPEYSETVITGEK